MSDIWNKIQSEIQAHKSEDPMGVLSVIKRPKIYNFNQAVAHLLTHHLTSGTKDEKMLKFILKTLDSNPKVEEQIQKNLFSTFSRDQACETLLTALILRKGFQALSLYRVSNAVMKSNKSFEASSLQYKSSMIYGVDIHPRA